MRRKPHAKDATCKDCGTVMSKAAAAKSGVLHAVRFASGKSTESSKQGIASSGTAIPRKQKEKSRHARAMPKKQQNGLRIASEVQMLPACLTACTWQKNQEPPVSGDGAGGSGEK